MRSSFSISDHCPIAALSPELLDQVFRLSLDGVSGAHKRSSIALVCTSWREPAQRVLFEKINTCKIKIYTPLRPALRLAVRQLNVVDPETKSGWSFSDLVHLIKSLPNLKYLKLNLYKAHLMTADYGILGILPNLEKLIIESKHFNEGLNSYRQLIAACPNIQSLTLKHGQKSHHRYYKPMRENYQTIDHPHLTHLSIKGIRLLEDFLKLRLLTEKTLNQIDHLGTSGVGNDPKFRQSGDWIDPLFDSIGINIKSLTLGAFQTQHLPSRILPGKLFKYCSNLETFKTYEAFDSALIPEKLLTLKYLGIGDWFPGEIMRNLPEGGRRWKNITKLELSSTRTLNSLSQVFLQALELDGIELTFQDPTQSSSPFPRLPPLEKDRFTHSRKKQKRAAAAGGE